MNALKCVVCVVLIAVSGAQCSCAGAKHPSRQVQLCLGGEQGVHKFMSLLKSIAQSQHMRFVDVSKPTETQFKSLNVDHKYKIIEVVVEEGNNSDTGLVAGNYFGAVPYQVAIGFGGGSNVSEDKKFADLVIRRLKENWPVYPVPQNQGAFPLKSCETKGNKKR